ncbi:hypothetical protein AAF712_009610 [Marasmius tenuissimus]|uniref:Uncharacterized protein n=1 Tax=Marasmius tenuissimus TaxID=585030 RepID=A0ABR2ZS02_9AGAR
MSSLPLPLLLLIHLHILQFPHVNEPQYDINLFNTSHRGLKERMKLMEDIYFFLVVCCEGSRASAKKILPTHPCSKPTDSPVFRASLAKYLEQLRHGALRSSSSTSTSLKSQGTTDKPWWGDIVVRKSLLEECAGDKFMRLIVSFSTHVLCERSGKGIPPSDEKLHESALAAKYFSEVDSAKLVRNSWCLSASRLQDAGRELEIHRAQLSPAEGQLQLAYGSLSTEKLLIVRDAKLKDLRRQWGPQAGSENLDFALELTDFRGLDGSEVEFDTTVHVVSSKVRVILSFTWADTSGNQDKTGEVSVNIPLPIAAARHPSHLRKLHKPIFESVFRQKSSIHDAGPMSKKSTTQVNPLLAHKMRGQVRMHSALKEALKRAQRPSVGHESGGERRVCLNLWHDGRRRVLDVEARPATFREFEALLNKSIAADTVPEPSRGVSLSRSTSTFCELVVAAEGEADLSDDDDVLTVNGSGAFASLLASSLSFDREGVKDLSLLCT